MYFYLIFAVILYFVFTHVLENFIVEQENFDPSLVPVSSIVTLAKVVQKIVNNNGTLINPGNLQIGSNTSASNLTVTGTSTVNGMLDVSGNTTLNNKLGVTGLSTLAGLYTYFSNGSSRPYSIIKNPTNLGFVGSNTTSTDYNWANTISMDNNANMKIGGQLPPTLGDGTGNLTVDGNTTINGNATINGALTLNASKNITISGIPSLDPNRWYKSLDGANRLYYGYGDNTNTSGYLNGATIHGSGNGEFYWYNDDTNGNIKTMSLDKTGSLTVGDLNLSNSYIVINSRDKSGTSVIVSKTADSGISIINNACIFSGYMTEGIMHVTSVSTGKIIDQTYLYGQYIAPYTMIYYQTTDGAGKGDVGTYQISSSDNVNPQSFTSGTEGFNVDKNGNVTIESLNAPIYPSTNIMNLEPDRMTLTAANTLLSNPNSISSSGMIPPSTTPVNITNYKCVTIGPIMIQSGCSTATTSNTTDTTIILFPAPFLDVPTVIGSVTGVGPQTNVITYNITITQFSAYASGTFSWIAIGPYSMPYRDLTIIP